MPAVRSRPKKGSRPGRSQARITESIEAEKFIDIGRCVLVCDWKLKDLLEHMIAHDFSKMSADEVARLAEKLPEHMHDDKRKRLSKTLNKPDLGGMQAKKLREYIRHTLRWSLYELQCVVEALGKDSDKLVGKLREIRDSLVDEYRKFKDKSERDTFLKTYDKFIRNFDFRKFFNSSRKAKREECLQFSLDYRRLVKMLLEYDKTKKMLSKEIADWEESYKKHLEALEAERDQLKEQVETLEEQLEREKAKRKALKVDPVGKQQQLAEKDKEIDKLKQQLTEVTEQLRKKEERLRSEKDASETNGIFEEKKTGMELDVSERDDTITEFNQKLVNIARERIILQNYFDSQPGGKARRSDLSVQVRREFLISQQQSHTTSSAVFGVATDGWDQFYDIGLCVIASDCKLQSLFELLLAASITTDNAVQVLFDSDDKNYSSSAPWQNKPAAEEQLEYLKNILSCIGDEIQLDGCTREELIFLIAAVNSSLTKLIGVISNMKDINLLRKEIIGDKNGKKCPLDKACEKLSDQLNKLLKKDSHIKAFQTALKLHFVQQRNLNAHRLHNLLRKVVHADLFKDTDELFKDAEDLRSKRNSVVHEKFQFSDEKEREKFLKTYKRVINQIDFDKVYPLDKFAEAKEAYLLPQVTGKEMANIAVEYDKAKKKCEQLEQELEEKVAQIREQKDQILEKGRRIEERENQIQEKERQIQEQKEQIRTLDKESLSMAQEYDAQITDLVQLVTHQKHENQQLQARKDEQEKEIKDLQIMNQQRPGSPEVIQVESDDFSISSLDERSLSLNENDGSSFSSLRRHLMPLEYENDGSFIRSLHQPALSEYENDN